MGLLSGGGSGSGRRVIVALAAIAVFASIYLVRIREDMVDFGVNHRAAERLLAGEPLYRTSDGHFMFKYFPVSAMVYAPLTVIPFEAAKLVWFFVTAGCTVAMFYLSRRLVAAGEARSWLVSWLPSMILAKFCLRELKLGQINTVVTLVLLAMLWSLIARDRERASGRAGLLWGVASLLKPYGLIFLPYFVVTGNVKALAAGVAVILGGFMLPALLYGVSGNLELHREWWASLTASTPAQFGVADNVSVVGALTKWSGDPAAALDGAIVVTVLFAGLVLLTMWRGRSVSERPVVDGALLLVLIPMISPMGWDYQFLTSVLAVTFLIEHFDALPLRGFLALNLAVIALSIYDVMGRSAYRAFMEASVLTVCFTVVIGYLFASRWRGVG